MRRHPVVQAPHRPASTPSAAGVLPRKCGCGRHRPGGGQCSACRKNKKKHPAVQRAATAAAPAHAVPASVADVLRSPGRPLDSATRTFFEPRFGHDFSRVRVHTDTRAAESAREVHSLAYVVGQDIVFGSGQYAPATPSGRDCWRTSWPTWCSKARPVGCRGP